MVRFNSDNAALAANSEYEKHGVSRSVTERHGALMLRCHPMTNFRKRCTSHTLKPLQCRMSSIKHPQITLAQKILIVALQLHQRTACNIIKIQFNLGRRPGIDRALGNILNAAPRRLYHLILRSALLRNITIAKKNRHIINQPAKLKCFQLLIPAGWQKQRAFPSPCHSVSLRVSPITPPPSKKSAS